MDLKPFKLDIDELIEDFAESGSLTFDEFKKVWLSNNFTYIFEAKPSTNQGFFMQSLYMHCLGYITTAVSHSRRLGGLCCLYCLYETQPFKPPFKIYLSLGELRQLKNFAVDAKQRHPNVVCALVKHMLGKNIFLFGSVGVNDGSAAERMNELSNLQNAQVQAAYRKLFADSRLEHFIHMDMNAELDIESIKKRSSDYALAKELAIKEASKAIDIDDMKRMAENEANIGVLMEKTAEDWNSQKDSFYQQTGFAPLPMATLPPEEAQQQNLVVKEKMEEQQKDGENEENGEFERELEDALMFQSMECEEDDED